MFTLGVLISVPAIIFFPPLAILSTALTGFGISFLAKGIAMYKQEQNNNIASHPDVDQQAADEGQGNAQEQELEVVSTFSVFHNIRSAIKSAGSSIKLAGAAIKAAILDIPNLSVDSLRSLLGLGNQNMPAVAPAPEEERGEVDVNEQEQEGQPNLILGPTVATAVEDAAVEGAAVEGAGTIIGGATGGPAFSIAANQKNNDALLY